MMSKNVFKLTAIGAAVAMTTGCLELDVSEEELNQAAEQFIESAAAKASSMYPTDFVLTSPFETTDAENGETRSSESSVQRDFSWMQSQLKKLRHNRIPLSRVFNAKGLKVKGHNADCFGPSLRYQNHPDDASNNSAEAELPSGDLGIWREQQANSGAACSAAQLNGKVKGMRYKTFSGLALFSSMLGQASKETSFDLVLSGGEIDLTDAMNTQNVGHIEFTKAVIHFDEQANIWRYEIALNYRQLKSDDPASAVFTMKVLPGANDDLYKGVMSYRVDGKSDNTQCADEKVESVGTIAFEKTSATEIKTQARAALFCGHDGERGFDKNGILDAAYSSVDNEDGWVSNFSIFTANVDPLNHAGNFAYTWQAGPQDSHSRVFNIAMTHAEGGRTGDAWYGFADSLLKDDAEETTVKGFICNWAGPGNSHALIDQVQRQSLSFNADAGRFEVGSSGSDISYAPVNACQYDSDSGGSFAYDRNLDGDLSDESAESNDVGEGEAIAFDLFPNQKSGAEKTSLAEALKSAGYAAPTAPVVGQ
jgi:hypothetical protein